MLTLACVGCGLTASHSATGDNGARRGVGGSGQAPGAGRVIHTVLQDDDLALFPPSSAGLTAFVNELKYLGVDELRVSAEWKLEAPNPDGAREPAHFDASDPRSYDDFTGMQLLDRAVRAAAGAGIGVIIDPAFSAPRWATSNPPTTQTSGDPWFNHNINVAELATWEGMLARRYDGRYTPAGASSPLPEVQTFTLWNEPNQVGFNGPQFVHGVPVVADWYRRVVRVAEPAIKRADPSARVLIGNTSATGSSRAAGNTGVPPITFIERVACVSAAFKPLKTSGCRHFTMLPADGYSMHPYERASPPWVTHPDQPFAEMGDLPRLQSVLDRLVAMHRLAPGARNLWLTEQGYGSDGELSGTPWSDAQQAQFNADSEYLAWRDPHLNSFAQFLLRDTLIQQTQALRSRTGNPHASLAGTYTTGLELQDGAPKPALAMFRAPVVARLIDDTRRTERRPPYTPRERVEVWGRARPMHQPTQVQVQTARGAQNRWRTVATPTTDRNGIFDVRMIVPADAGIHVRFRWRDPQGDLQTSPSTTPALLGGHLRPRASTY